MKHIILIFIISTLLVSCNGDYEEDFVEEGMKPVYMDKSLAKKIFSEGAKDIINPGKINVKYPYIFINEKGKGVHVINNFNPVNPIPMAFINIPGNVDIAVRGNLLYADNFFDLLTIDISDLQNAQVVHRVSNAFPEHMMLYPQDYFGYFECVDTTKGYVIGWEKAVLQNPKCHR